MNQYDGGDTRKLISEIKNGDKSNAFAVISVRYAPLIESVIHRFRETAYIGYDDLRQEALIALYGAACTYDDGENVSFGYYAGVCIKRRVISIATRSGTPLDELEDDIECMPFDGSDPEAAAINAESFAALSALIDSSLTSFEKTVFNLYILGKSYEEISFALGRNIKSVDNALYRIKAKIRRLI